MTPAERDEVRRRASDRLADHSMATVTSNERCACDRCDDDRAILRYVPPGEAADSSIVPYAADLRALVESQRRDYLDVCDAIAPETSGPADAAAKVRALRANLAEAKRLGLEACDRATHTEQCGKTQADYHHSKGYRGCPGEDEDCTCGLAAIAAALEAL